jgi:hypothetical protein
MPQDLFEHIVFQLRQITPYPVRLHVDGEPTLHPKFHEYGKILNRNNIPFVLATNGSRLSEDLLDLKMDVLISISTNRDEFQQRTTHIDFDVYIKKIVNYLKGWLLSDSLQTIYIQTPYYRSRKKEKYVRQKIEFAQTLEKELALKKYSKKSTYNRLNAEYCYIKPNGHLLVTYQWAINKRQIHRRKSFFDLRTKRGFCSSPWQELAILADGRVSFCCVDLTGGTAFTARQEIWEHSLLELWGDERLAIIRRNLKKRKVQLKICQRCLGDAFRHARYTKDHPFDTVFSPKSKELFPVDSVGCPRNDKTP